MIDLRTDDGLARALREIADWPPNDAQSYGLEPSAQPRRRRTLLVAAAGLALVVLVATVLAARQSPPLDAAAGEWRSMAPAPLAARFDPATVWTGDELLVVGGYDASGDEFVDGAAYDPGADRWRMIAPFPGEREQRAGAGVGESGGSQTFAFDGEWVGDEAIFVVGGVGPEIWDFDVVAYDPDADSWRTVSSPRFTQLPSDALVPLAGEPTVHAPYGVVAHEGRLLVYGWRSDLGEFGWSFVDPATGEWSEFNVIEGSGELYIVPLAAGAPVVMGGRYLVVVRNLGSHLGPAGFVADLETGESRSIEYPPTPLSDIDHTSLHGALAASGLYVGGAFVQDDDDSFFEGVSFRFDPVSASWTSAPPVGPAWNDDSFPTLASTPQGEVAIGGLEIDYGVRNDPEAVAALLPPGEARWRPLPEPPFDTSRMGHTVVWTGTEVLVWGGAVVDPDGAVNSAVIAVGDGARFRPD